MKKLLIITLIFISNLCVAQKINNDSIKVKINAVSLNFFGTTPVSGIAYERIISNRSSIEFGLGYVYFKNDISAGIGYKFYLNKIDVNKIKFYTGLSVLYQNHGSIYTLDDFAGYIPFGISYFSKKGYFWGVDIGPSIGTSTMEEMNQYEENKIYIVHHTMFGPYLGLKFGYRF